MPDVKRLWNIVLAALCLFGSFAGFAAAQAVGPAASGAADPSSSNPVRQYGVSVYVNGRAVPSPYAAYTRRSDGTVYVSVRSIAEALGMKVAWNAPKRLAEIVTSNGRKFAFPLYRNDFWFDGQRYFLKSGTEAETDGSPWGLYVMIPSSAVGRLLQADVRWDEPSRRLDIAKPDGAVSAGVAETFAREWDVWQPEPQDSLQLAKALFDNVRIGEAELKVTVPAGSERVRVLYAKGAEETTLAPGKTYSYRIGERNARIYAYRTDPSGAIAEEYRIWLDPGSPGLAYGIYGGQGLRVIIQDMHGKVASLERMKQVIANFGKLANCGTADFGRSGAAARLPLYCIAADYGASEPGRAPAVRPKAPLPAVAFEIPQELELQLAAYWMNLDPSGGENGLLLIGPRGWEIVSAAVGADGSAGMTMRDPEDPQQRWRVFTIPGCQGCAVSAIGTYFPSLGKWAEDQGFPGSPLPFAEQTPLDDHTIAYSLKPDFPGETVQGIAFERHGGGGSAFAGAEMAAEDGLLPVIKTMKEYWAYSIHSWL
jgi:hypothetical protein